MEPILHKIYLTCKSLLIVHRFMARSLSNLVNNLSEGTHRVKFKYKHDDKKCETCGIKYKYCDRFLEYTNLKIL